MTVNNEVVVADQCFVCTLYRDRSGCLTRDELRRLLTDINGGQTPTEEEVQFVLWQGDDADGVHDGVVCVGPGRAL